MPITTHIVPAKAKPTSTGCKAYSLDPVPKAAARRRPEHSGGVELGARRGASLVLAKPAPFDPQGRSARRRHAYRNALRYMYDLVVLAVAVAFLLRFAWTRLYRQRGLGLAVSGALILSFPYVKTQVGWPRC